MDVVHRERRALITNVTRLENDIFPFDLNNLMLKSEIQDHLKDLELMKNQCRTLLIACSNAAANDGEYRKEEPEFMALELRLSKISVKLKTMLEAHGVITTATTAGTSDVKLPKLELPIFSGDVKDWLSFQDLFLASVHNNGKLSGAQKLQYLKASLKGEAAALVQNIQVTDGNYAGAWDALKIRYENRREIIKSHFDRLLSLPNLNQENPDMLRKLGDQTNECVRALDVLKITAEQTRDLLIVHLISRKFDNDSKLEWEKSLGPDDIPKIKEFTDFILRHARVTAAAGIKSKVNVKENSKSSVGSYDKKTCAHIGTEKQDCCLLCKKSKHYLSKCEDFKKMTRKERVDYLKKTGRCFKCLELGHRSQDCTWPYDCRTCSEPHNVMIHFERKEVKTSENVEEQKSGPGNEENKAQNLFACNVGRHDDEKTLLSTALIKITNEKKQTFFCRALLDNGSQVSFITTKCATKLGLKTHSVNLPISGLGELAVGTSQLGVNLEFGSKYNSQKTFCVEAHVLKNITGNLPTETIKRTDWKHIEGLQLADPYFYEPGNIDVLLGGDIYEDLMKNKRRKGPDGSPWARESYLGWVLLGKYKSERNLQPARTHHAMSEFVEKISNFWEIEEIPTKQNFTQEETKCEQHFEENYERDLDGRYIVKLPFKENRKQIGESRSIAIMRLQAMERKYSKTPEVLNEYYEVLQGYLDLNHMERIPDVEVLKKTEVYYMPFHVVFNPSSTTTPVRIVFDASAKSTSGVSLNDCLMVGPKTQDDLVAILIRFMVHKIVLSADIAKMYRQVKVHKDDVDFQRIVWRKSTTDPIQDYRLTTATFGTASAPYHAVKTVQHLAESEKSNFPEAAEVISRDFYVDDLLTGSASQEEALKLQNDLLVLLKKGQFDLRKWSSNDVKLLDSLPEELRETISTLDIDLDSTIKTLGLLWHPAEDYFSFKVNVSENEATTKRQVLSQMATIFDPLGWLSPVTMKVKIFFQELWRMDLGWDDRIPDEQLSVWRKYTEELVRLREIQVPRRATFSASEKYYLDGYCDASEKAYAAVVYLRSENENETMTKLIASKTKVAPVKSKITLPRLELCGAVLLRRLLQYVNEALSKIIMIDKISCWTDSTIVLGWISRHPATLKTFVGNRVSEIQEFLPAENWSHIRGLENPADCASRGVYPSELEKHSLWWNGPPHPYVPGEKPPIDENDSRFQIEIKEIKTTSLTASVNSIEEDRIDWLMKKCSDWQKMQRTVAYLLRFKCNASKKPEERKFDPLSVQEINCALTKIVKKVQGDSDHGFVHEIEQMMQGQKVSKQLRRWSPFIDKDGILRVGGRLQNAEVDYDKKHPMLISGKHYVTKLIVRHYHKELQHAGPQLLLSRLQEKFWVIGGRNTIKKILRCCVTCTRQKAETCEQLMGSLPKARVNPARAFLHCGVDFAGPYILKNPIGRKPVEYKGYIAVFICLVTRAIHLELVSDMTTDSFLQTFKRFAAVRGLPSDVYSDNGTNFVGADKELKRYLKIWNEETIKDEIKNYMTTKGVTWHFNPPSTPHFGGLWEAGVKSMKYHLKRIVGKQTLTYEEMLTMLKQVEACLNSRPLSPLSTDPSDVAALTPGHFLIGDALTAVPEPNLTEVRINRLSRWQMIQQMFQHFWRRWSGEHLSRMQEKPKWWNSKKNLEIGNLVLIKDDNHPPLMWKMGRILEVIYGKDDIVRVVKLKTQDGELTRPIVKLCLLPLDND